MFFAFLNSIDRFIWTFAQTLTVTQDLSAIPTPIKIPLEKNNYTRAHTQPVSSSKTRNICIGIVFKVLEP